MGRFVWETAAKKEGKKLRGLEDQIKKQLTDIR